MGFFWNFLRVNTALRKSASCRSRPKVHAWVRESRSAVPRGRTLLEYCRPVPSSTVTIRPVWKRASCSWETEFFFNLNFKTDTQFSVCFEPLSYEQLAFVNLLFGSVKYRADYEGLVWKEKCKILQFFILICTCLNGKTNFTCFYFFYCGYWKTSVDIDFPMLSKRSAFLWNLSWK